MATVSLTQQESDSLVWFKQVGGEKKISFTPTEVEAMKLENRQRAAKDVLDPLTTKVGFDFTRPPIIFKIVEGEVEQYLAEEVEESERSKCLLCGK